MIFEHDPVSRETAAIVRARILRALNRGIAPLPAREAHAQRADAVLMFDRDEDIEHSPRAAFYASLLEDRDLHEAFMAQIPGRPLPATKLAPRPSIEEFQEGLRAADSRLRLGQSIWGRNPQDLRLPTHQRASGFGRLARLLELLLPDSGLSPSEEREHRPTPFTLPANADSLERSCIVQSAEVDWRGRLYLSLTLPADIVGCSYLQLLAPPEVLATEPVFAGELNIVIPLPAEATTAGNPPLSLLGKIGTSVALPPALAHCLKIALDYRRNIS